LKHIKLPTPSSTMANPRASRTVTLGSLLLCSCGIDIMTAAAGAVPPRHTAVGLEVEHATATPFPVGTISNGTCGAVYVAGVPATDTVGYFEPVPTLAACVAKVLSSCPLANYVSWSSLDHSCAWYSKCDMATLCVDCSAGSCTTPPNPQCPVCSDKCPPMDPPYPHTSEVIRKVAPAPAPPTPFPVGTIGNGTCGEILSKKPNDCATDAQGYFEDIPTLAACAAKVKSCPLGNYVSWSSKDNSCAWYNTCDMATLCVRCDAPGACAQPRNPQCPQCSRDCPSYWPHTSEVIKKIAPPPLTLTPFPPRD